MRSTRRLSVVGLAAIVGLVAGSPVLLSMSNWVPLPPAPAIVASAFDQPATGLAGKWTVAGDQMSATNTLVNSGVTVTVFVTNGTGGTATSNNIRTSLVQLGSSRGALPSDFEVPPVDTTTYALPVDFNKDQNGCPVPAGIVAGQTYLCQNVGTIRIEFSQPVTNPIISVGGIGWSDGPDPTLPTYLTNSVLKLLQPAGATMAIRTSNGVAALADSATTLTTANLGASANCHENLAVDTTRYPSLVGITGVPFAANASCGSIEIIGSGQVFEFGVSLRTFGLEADPGITDQWNDAFNIQVGAYPNVTLAYDCNAGTGSQAGITTAPGTSVTIAGGSGCSRSGYTFAGWNTAANGSGTSVAAGSAYTLNADTTLYAVWTPVPTPPAPAPAPAPAGGGGGGAAPAATTDSSTPTPAPSDQGPPGPLAVNDSATTQLNTPVTVNAATNDTYPAGSVFTQVSSPANGTVSWNANGTYTYTPRPGFTGIDSFTYQVCMPAPYQDRCSQATDFITVRGADPQARPQAQKVRPGSPRPLRYTPVGLSRPASGSNLKPGSVAIAQTGTGKWGNRVVVPGKGTWVLKGTQVEFVPAKGFTGQTTIRYRIQDRNGKWAYSTLTAAAPAIPTGITGGW